MIEDAMMMMVLFATTQLIRGGCSDVFAYRPTEKNITIIHFSVQFIRWHGFIYYALRLTGGGTRYADDRGLKSRRTVNDLKGRNKMQISESVQHQRFSSFHSVDPDWQKIKPVPSYRWVGMSGCSVDTQWMDEGMRAVSTSMSGN